MRNMGERTDRRTAPHAETQSEACLVEGEHDPQVSACVRGRDTWSGSYGML